MLLNKIGIHDAAYYLDLVVALAEEDVVKFTNVVKEFDYVKIGLLAHTYANKGYRGFSVASLSKKSSPELMTCLLFQSSYEKEHLKALQTLLSCPTSSISSEKPTRDSVSEDEGSATTRAHSRAWEPGEKISILAEGGICESQRRASSDGLGLLAPLGNDLFTVRLASLAAGMLIRDELSNQNQETTNITNTLDRETHTYVNNIPVSGNGGGWYSRPLPNGQRICKFYKNGRCKRGLPATIVIMEAPAGS
ncbi:protein SWEETIE isoform X1 [Tanacetum coccineum]|uniref:Protein SWEETIE isoform X1 n=1 Tax=Tanacetum coccineum TaxID=301880 RepID=A0ABQ5B725_9ASTR